MSQISCQNNIQTVPPRLLQESIYRGHQRDANLCGAFAQPTDKRSLLRGRGGYNRGSYVYFAKGYGGWVFAGVDGVACVDVEGSSVCSGLMRRGPAARAGQVVYAQNRNGYEKQGSGREGGGSEVLWGVRVLCGCEVLAEHGVGSGEREDKQSRRRAPMV